MAIDFQTLIQNAREGGREQITTLESLGRDNLQRRKDWSEEREAQTYDHKKRMFDMVHWMTTTTYLTVLVIVLTQVFQVRLPSSFLDFIFLRWISANDLSLEKFGLILTGFLAELLLLPKIILYGLFNGKNDEK